MPSELPRDLLAVVLKNGDVICARCIEETPDVLDDNANTVVLSTDSWKGEVVIPDAICDRCEHEFTPD